MSEIKAKELSKIDALKSLRKIFGNDGVFSGDTNISITTEPISTGSYGLDEAIGIGGIPMGRITQFGGATGSGKTFMSLQCVKQWQSIDPDNWALWYDAEFSFDLKWAKRLGVDINRLHIIRENDGAKIFNSLCGIPHPKTSKLVGGILNELVEAHGKESGLGLIVIDSIASTVPPVEASYDLSHQNFAALARFLPAALKRISPLLESSNVAMIFINQVRIDPSVKYGNPESSPGGNALKHHEHLMVNFNKSNAAEKRIENKNGDPIGHTILTRIDKNRIGLPGRKIEIRIKYEEGIIDHNIELLNLGVGYSVIVRPNLRTYLYKDYKWTSRDSALNGLLDKEIQKQLYEDILKVKNSGCGFNDNIEEQENE